MRFGTIALGIIVASIDQVPSRLGPEPVLPEPIFYYELSLAAKPLGLDVYVFTPADYDKQERSLYAYRLHNKLWTRQQVPLPDIVFDRCFFTRLADRRLCQDVLADMNIHKPHQLLNGRLPSKLQVYTILRSDHLLSPYLPDTSVYQSHEQLKQLTAQYTSGVILKPAAGMQGRGILHVKRCSQTHSMLVAGNSPSNRFFFKRFFDPIAFERWLSRFMKRSAFLIQPYLQLTDDCGRPFDVRALLQKDKHGRWRLTGTAVRQGQAGSITSNLHSGGHASPSVELLSAKYDKAGAEHLLQEIHTISGYTANRLEHCLGRFAELAFDYGIEPDGKLWLIEINSKPGRAAFRLINDSKTQKRAVERLLHYAQFLYNRLTPTFTASESAKDRFRYLNMNNRLRPFNVQEVHR